MTRNTHVDSPAASASGDQYAILRQLRSQLIAHYRPLLQDGPGPIRIMARIVTELEQACRKQHISEEVIQAEIVNRTIGDINLRLVTECEGEPGGSGDYRLLADELGVALPGETLPCGYTATGETYLWLRNQMMECERLLLEHNFDPRIYDIYGTGNPLLRSWLARDMQTLWGLPVSYEQLYLSLGAMDGIDKVLRGLALTYRSQDSSGYGILFPEPGFGVPEWQARSYGYELYRIQTREENRFKLSAAELDQALQAHPDIKLVYLTISNNPTAFAFNADELNALHAVLRRYRSQGRDILILADLAYIGTAPPQEDQARMATFIPEDILQHTIFVSSLSKTNTLTGERFGWVTAGSKQLANAIAACWTNSTASLPGEWQLRYMAYYRLIQERPWLNEKLRRFYRLRRRRFIEQLETINQQQRLFEAIYLDDDATVYNWSKFAPGEDAFSFFEKTGIAGVPGSGFGYTDQYVRFSIGFLPVEQSTMPVTGRS
ncbi:aspartate/methionine/tyrosine aminotransferase [Thermosporothrix hazakensis]|jgi:aspartate/methionine/tyrosine aminotransferase|uniref:Aspartate/methionine/tyrosine aminotransferase n=2 Tax=Thermosporothrix TaxID=768650 RepID=A0A326TZI1_THEHA|nr:pyridoxal phosphate-dependent aminotransferase [Thermosporothrix hazakensis]PZW22909.1 aspartate/methionine/tyrosine aminotransferase [Thermosporothrix hazakensis]BBH89814.1 hypothetical protein KTC_45650 [Thermosporothrix sp. COM3]